MKKRKESDEVLSKKRKDRKNQRKEKFFYSSPRFIINNIRYKCETKIIENKNCIFYKYINSLNIYEANSNVPLVFKIDEAFCLRKNYEFTIKKILDFYNSLFINYGKEITLDFSECSVATNFTLSLLNMFVLKFNDYNKTLKRRLVYQYSDLKIRIRHPKNKEVKNELILTGILRENVEDKKESYIPVHNIGYIKAQTNKKNYLENQKGKYCLGIVSYINDSLKEHDVELSNQGKRNIEHLVGEILSNCEDHGSFGEYYFTANLSSKKENNNVISKLNLTFLNIGKSIYSSFIDSKSSNIKDYMDLFSLLQKEGNINIESFTNLYILNEGISRLNKINTDSRGTGTIKFMNSFFDLCDTNVSDDELMSEISIISGKSYVKIVDEHKPFKKSNRYFISLNRDKDITKIPEEGYLKNNTVDFPGTIINFQALLNKNHYLNNLKSDE